MWWTAGTARGGAGHLGLTETQRGRLRTAWGWGKLACARGGSRLSPEGGGGGVWEMDTCDRTYVWSSLSVFFFFLVCYTLSDF